MADTHKLSPELISLVHHIELNKAGWWELAVQRLVLTAFWVKRGTLALNRDEVKAALATEFGIALDGSLIDNQLQTLIAAGQLVVLPDGRFKIGEETIRGCERDLAEAVDLEATVRQRFQALLADSCPAVDASRAWDAFSEKFLLPTVSELGANTYRLITGSGVEIDLPQLKPFTDSFPSAETVGLHNFVRAFLDPADPSVRRYVLRAMNAYFVVRASGLNRQTVERLAKSATQQPATVLFFDTNVLFSLLGLHQNPADEGSLALMSLVQKLSTSVPIKLRVLIPTLDEMKRAITASQEAVINMRISPRLLDTAATLGISGITEKFLRLSAGRGATVSPADYFEPYLKNLLTILRGNGVELFSQDLSSYKTRQDVIDDLLQQQEFEKQRYGERAKNYERLEHDMVLWHFVKDKRPPRPESPIDAEYWIVTADYRLLGFDAHQQRKIGTDVPICLHPTTLTQLLQFWIPQTPEFEQALLSTMRLPTVLTLMDADAERVSLKILNALSTFENIGNLPPETTTRVLLNDALRQKLSVEDDIARQVELVREALIEENKKAEQRLNEEKLRAAQLQQDGEKLQVQLSSAVSEIQGLRKDLERNRTEAAANKSAAQKTEEKLAAYIAAGERRTIRRNFALKWIGILVVTVAAALGGVRRFRARPQTTIAILGALAILWLWLADRAGRRSVDIKEWPPLVMLGRFRVWVYGTLLAGALGSAVWDGAKALWPASPEGSKPSAVQTTPRSK
jgi:hypothetical protein